MHRRQHFRLRLVRSLVRAPRDRIHPAGRLRAHRLPGRSRRPTDLHRRPTGGVHGRCLGGLRRPGPSSSRPQRRPGRTPRHVDARGDHPDAKQRMAALTAAAEATGHTVAGSAVHRTRQGRLRRHRHGDGPAVARLRRDGGLPRVHRDTPAAIPDRPMGLPRLDSGVDRPVDAGAHRRRDRRTRAALPVAARPARQRLDHSRHGPPADAWRLYRQPNGIPAAARTVADVGRRAGAAAQGA